MEQTQIRTPRRKPSAAAKNLAAELQQFVSEHRDGWGDREWTTLLNRLHEQGHDLSSVDTIGLELEKQRLRARLSAANIPNLGPRRIDSIVSRYQTIWALKRQRIEDVAIDCKVTAEIAQMVINAA